jgi:SAM-dependent methyltransferase
MTLKSGKYWDSIAFEYQETTTISIDDFHYGPLVPGERRLNLFPFDVNGRRCLEIGCGAGQNSVFLAKNGAECLAFDVSEKQLMCGRSLCRRSGVEVDFRQVSMDDPEEIDGRFDLIHSVCAISFSREPAKVAEFAATHLADGGCFILSTEHPLARGELLDLDDDTGVFIQSYFDIPPDVRLDDDGNEEIRSTHYPLSEIARWITDAGMSIEGFHEPVVDPANLADAPYVSDAWLEYAGMFARVPAVAVIICRKHPKSEGNAISTKTT